MRTRKPVAKRSREIKRQIAPAPTPRKRISPHLKSAIRQDLAVEFYSRVSLALGEFGLSAVERRSAFDRSQGLAKAPPVSGPLLRDFRGLCSLLLEWSREAAYLAPDGKPRVLALKGPGATFESLARRFVPSKPLNEVVAMACATAEVTTRPGGKIALLGSIMVNVANSTEHSLAHAIRQIDQLLKTILHNNRVRRPELGNGHLERMVTGVIESSQFSNFVRELRPQISDLLQRVDSSVQLRQPKSHRSLRDATAVSVGIYVSREQDWERAGIDASVLVDSRQKAQRRPRRG
jgi:hypothetical protein